MALRESSHAHRGRLGVYTKKEEKIRTYPKKKNKSKKKRGSGFVAPRFTGEKRERERDLLKNYGLMVTRHTLKRVIKTNLKRSKKIKARKIKKAKL